MSNHTEAFVSGYITVKGFGFPPLDSALTEPQKRALSLRAARVMALRAAVEALDGVIVNGKRTVKDATKLSEEVKISVSSFVRGAEVLTEEYDEESETATVTLRVPLTGTKGMAAMLLGGTGSVVPEMPFFTTESKARKAGNYDGLIIDARGLGFRPAIVNRLVVGVGEESKVLFAPSMITVAPMERAGAVGYTDDPQRAIEILSESGSVNPVTIKPVGLSAGGTDAVVGLEDAKLVSGANSLNAFLKRGRVVFVLGRR
ncbi:MAG: hypothetical protein IME99_01515 [Proteobacteria bacterium]|nr:hypothetical protein [Pseudomonadota bacterium]